MIPNRRNTMGLKNDMRTITSCPRNHYDSKNDSTSQGSSASPTKKIAPRFQNVFSPQPRPPMKFNSLSPENSYVERWNRTRKDKSKSKLNKILTTYRSLKGEI